MCFYKRNTKCTKNCTTSRLQTSVTMNIISEFQLPHKWTRGATFTIFLQQIMDG